MGETGPHIEPIDPIHPEPQVLAQAADILRQGGLVAFPTETVYGLGAHGLDAAACRRIFDAKGRPSTNPLILHVASIEQAKELGHWNSMAQVLAEAFWPGPLTLVLRRKSVVPDEVAASGPTVGIRVPRHPVALGLARACGFPIAAPSANRSNEVSPTLAAHVLESLGDRVDWILDGGACPVGIESTVVDVTEDDPRVLRPGHTLASQIEAITGRPVRLGPSGPGPSRSPGLMERHYAPRTPLELFENRAEALAQKQNLEKMGKKVKLVCGGAGEDRLVWGDDPGLWQKHLYRALRTWDQEGWDRILVAIPGVGEAWLGVLDRLRRASHPPEL